jgi:coenzyme F420-reducing hydrogenase delta subunit
LELPAGATLIGRAFSILKIGPRADGLNKKPVIRPERLQFEWISAAEGTKFARVMKEL